MSRQLLCTAILVAILTGTCSAQRPNVLPKLVDDVSQTEDKQKLSEAYYGLLRVAIDEAWDIDALATLAVSEHGHLRALAARVLSRVPANRKNQAVKILTQQLEVETSCLASSPILRSLSMLGALESRDAAAQIVEVFEEKVVYFLDQAGQGDEGYREFAIRICDEISKDLCPLGDVRNGVRLWLMAQRLAKPNTKPPNTETLPRKAAIELARVAQSKSNPARGHAVRGLARFGFTNRSIQSNLLALLTPQAEPLKQDRIELAISKVRAPHSKSELRTLAIDALSHLALENETVTKALRPIVDENSADSVVAARSLARLNDDTGLALLTRALRDSSSSPETIELLGIIGHLGPKAVSCIESITSLSFKDNSELEHAAETCLARIAKANPTALLPHFDAGSDEIKAIICEALFAIGKASEPVAKELLNRFDRASEKTKVAIASSLLRTEQLPASYVPNLLALLKSENQAIRLAALLGLSQSKHLPNEALQHIIDLVTKDSADPNDAPAVSLAFGDLDALPRPLTKQLADAVPTASEQLLQLSLAHHFIDIGATPAILKLLTHENTRVRSNAVAALRKRKELPPPVVDKLRHLINDDSALVAANAVHSLLSIDPTAPNAIGAAKQLLDNPVGRPLSVFASQMLFRTLIELRLKNEQLQLRAVTYLSDPDNTTRSLAAQFVLTFDPTSLAAKDCLYSAIRNGTHSLTEAVNAMRSVTPDDSRLPRLIRMRLEDQNAHVQRWTWKASRNALP